MTYPKKITDRLNDLRYAATGGEGGGRAVAVNFACGSAIQFEISIDHENAKVDRISYRSNGCGFMLASAEMLAESVSLKKLGDLNGLSSDKFYTTVRSELDLIADGRDACFDAVIAGLRGAFADHRSRQVEEFRGESALICTCFAVTEQTVIDAIQKKGLTTIDDVTNACGAGGGCGSCRMLIDEMLSTSGFGK